MGRLRGVVVVVMVVMILGGVEVMLVGVVPLRKKRWAIFSFFALSSNVRLYPFVCMRTFERAAEKCRNYVYNYKI